MTTGAFNPSYDALHYKISGVLADKASRGLEGTMYSALSQIHACLPFIVDEARKRLAVKSVWLFGSRQRGDYRDNSDIDLAFDVPEDHLQHWERFAVFTRENARTLLNLDLVNLQTCSDGMRQSIFAQGKRIYGR